MLSGLNIRNNYKQIKNNQIHEYLEGALQASL